MKYEVLTINAVFGLGTDFDRAARELSERVNQAILDGWRPLGGVAVGNTQSMLQPFLFQAMTRE